MSGVAATPCGTTGPCVVPQPASTAASAASTKNEPRVVIILSSGQSPVGVLDGGRFGRFPSGGRTPSGYSNERAGVTTEGADPISPSFYPWAPRRDRPLATLAGQNDGCSAKSLPRIKAMDRSPPTTRTSLG